jgi:hypothetical protein
MVSKSIVIAYSYTKQHCKKKNENNYSHIKRRIHLYTDVKIWSPLKRSNLVVVWRASNVDRHPKLAANKNIKIQISAI